VTIAACYVSAEGVVFGADSTSTIFVPAVAPGAIGTWHHYNFAQKVFQVGEISTVGMTMWGLGALAALSYRTLIAQFADSLKGQTIRSMADVADRWNQFFWSMYSTDLATILRRAQTLQTQSARTPDEEDELEFLLQSYSGGFCVGGCLMNDRTPSAYQILYDPMLGGPGPIDAIPLGGTRFWGCPNLIYRLIYGLDTGTITAILQSGEWSGTQDELYSVLVPYCLGQPRDLPIREAIDWVHASIYTTIKTMKFSHMAPVCGGPVEIAVITTDRPFRWVRHKGFDAAIGEGGLFDVYRVAQ
jgi:hypothetical protein